MATDYNPGAGGPRLRDEMSPSKVAGQRPALTTRVKCEQRDDFLPEDVRNDIRDCFPQPGDEALRGGIRGGSRVDSFNHALRSGHGFRSEGDE